MRGVKFAWSLLAATGVVGAAGAASAGTVTVTDFGIAGGGVPFGTTSQDITLAGASSPQYNYNSSEFKIWTTSYLTPNGSNGIGDWSATPGMPSASETFSNSQVTIATAFKNPGVQNDYLHLEFQGAGGAEYLGYATFDPAGDLESITYGVPGGVPEPASWALLIAGVGLTGGAMRRRGAGAVAAVAA